MIAKRIPRLKVLKTKIFDLYGVAFTTTIARTIYLSVQMEEYDVVSKIMSKLHEHIGDNMVHLLHSYN